MTIERKVFRGIGAVIASVETDRVFEIAPKMRWEDATDFRREQRIRIDLGRCPSQAGSWSDIEIDDRGIDVNGEFLGSAMCVAHLTGYHVTSLGSYIGPRAPEDLVRGLFVGAVYLEDNVFNAHRSKIDPVGDPWPTRPRTPCQLTTVAYSSSTDNGDRRGKRYAGFLGRLTRVSGSLATIELLDLTGIVMGTWDFDLSSADHCDPAPPLSPDETALRLDSQTNSTGAIFVELRHVAHLKIDNPKLPIGLDP